MRNPTRSHLPKTFQLPMRFPMTLAFRLFAGVAAAL